MAEDAGRQDDVVGRREFVMFLRIAAGVATVVVGAAGLVFLQLLEVNKTLTKGDRQLRDVIDRRIDEGAQEEIIERIEEFDEDLKPIINGLIENVEEVKADTTTTLQRLGAIEGIVGEQRSQHLELLREVRE